MAVAIVVTSFVSRNFKKAPHRTLSMQTIKIRSRGLITKHYASITDNYFTLQPKLLHPAFTCLEYILKYENNLIKLCNYHKPYKCESETNPYTL